MMRYGIGFERQERKWETYYILEHCSSCTVTDKSHSSDASTKISPLYNGSGTLDPFDVDYWWIQDVDKGDLVLLNIQIPTIFDWQSRLYYSNLTLIYENTTDGTHIYEFHAKETDNYYSDSTPATT